MRRISALIFILIFVTSAPGAEVEDLGIPGNLTILQSGGVNEELGELVFGTFSSGTLATFLRYDIDTREQIESVSVAGGRSLSALTFDDAGTTFFAVDKTLYRYNPLVHPEPISMGIPLPNEIRISALITGRDGMIYGGTWGSGRVFRLDPQTEEIKDFGPFWQDAQYVQSTVLGPDGKMYSGLGTPARVMIFDPVAETTQELFLNIPDQNFAFVIGGNGFDQIFVMTRPDGYLRVVDINSQLVVSIIIPDDPAWLIESAISSSSREIIYSAVRNKNLFRFNLETKISEPIGALEYGFPFSGLEFLSDGRLLAFNGEGKYFIINLETDDKEFGVFPNLPSEAQEIFSLGLDLEENVYVGLYLNNYMSKYNVNSGEMELLGNALANGGEIYKFENVGAKIYFATYYYSVLSEFNPLLPWNPGLSESSNPREIGRFGDDQTRPYALVKGEGNTLYCGTGPDYGGLDGHVFSYNIETKEFLDLGIPVDNHHVSTLIFDGQKSLLYGGTGSVSEGLFAGATPEDAHFFVYDLQANQVIFDATAVSGETQIQAMALAGNGVVYFTTFPGGHLYAFQALPSVETGQLLPVAPPFRKPTRILVNGPDGKLYGSSAGSIYSFDPWTHFIETLGDTGNQNTLLDSVFDSQGNFYFGGKNGHLYRLDRLISSSASNWWLFK